MSKSDNAFVVFAESESVTTREWVAHYHFTRPVDAGVDKLRVFWDTQKWRVEGLLQNPKAIGSSQSHEEFFFCLLGGFGITYEANLAAYNVLHENGSLTREWFQHRENGSEEISRLLAGPLTMSEASGKKISYRFPNAKASTLSRAASWLESTLDWDLDSLRELPPFEAREALMQCPGMGYKTASWFLRNIGHGQGLSIIDVHIERVTKLWAIVPFGLTPQKDYLEMEARLLHACEKIDAPVEVLDLVLWQYARGDFGHYEYESEQLQLF